MARAAGTTMAWGGTEIVPGKLFVGTNNDAQTLGDLVVSLRRESLFFLRHSTSDNTRSALSLEQPQHARSQTANCMILQYGHWQIGNMASLDRIIGFICTIYASTAPCTGQYAALSETPGPLAASVQRSAQARTQSDHTSSLRCTMCAHTGCTCRSCVTIGDAVVHVTVP
jgi:hypothetical protein